MQKIETYIPLQSPPYWYQVDAPVILDNTISDKAKIIYTIISGLTVKTGECWASNEYLAKMLNCDKSTVSRCITELKEKGHIKSIVEDNYRRSITLGYVRNKKGDTQKCLGGYSNLSRGDTQKCVYNNTNINNTNKERGENKFSPPSLDEVIRYCKERKNKVNPDSFINFYESKGWLIGKTRMKDWRAAVRTWEQRDKIESIEYTVKPVEAQVYVTEMPDENGTMKKAKVKEGKIIEWVDCV